MRGVFLPPPISHHVRAQASGKIASRKIVIKKIESYLELADPQLQPRYSGIPTFFRLPPQRAAR
jgi:hypothetical protein